MTVVIARTAIAVLIAISASVGAQDPENTTNQAQPSPQVLGTSAVIVEPSKEQSASATLASEASSSAEVAQISDAEQKKQEEKAAKVEKLQKYLQSMNSPMADNAQDFVDAAEQYNLDWKMLPAIAGVESTFGKHVPQGSYNPFGWGNGGIHFTSWRDAIFTVAESLSRNYVQKGLVTPYQIQPVYAPPSHTWGGKVDYFMKKIDSYTPESK